MEERKSQTRRKFTAFREGRRWKNENHEIWEGRIEKRNSRHLGRKEIEKTKIIRVIDRKEEIERWKIDRGGFR